MKREKEYYLVHQGMVDSRGNFIEAILPITDESMLKMLGIGIAKALGTSRPVYPASWGSGIYERDEEGNYICISSDYDTTG